MELGFVKRLLELYEACPARHLDDAAGTSVFDPPLVAVADAADAWFDRFKETIGPFHWTPQEALALAAPSAKARSVISWCLPISQAVRLTNRIDGPLPSRSWAYTRTAGDKVLGDMERGLAAWLAERGFAAVAPNERAENTVESRPVVGWSSRWSQRHVAFVAGLGTFGISGGLITPRGIAHRLGSVVTEAAIAPTPRPYDDDPFAWCLRSSQGKCGACIQRCPVGSVGQTIGERNKLACFEHSRRIKAEGQTLFGWEGRYGCGLCQTGVPCEFARPS